MQHLSLRYLSISGISQLSQTWVWPNFKGRFLGPSWTDSNCHADICPDNICPCDICPYQEYLSCYWPYFYQTLKVDSWDHRKHIPTVTGKKMHGNLSMQHLSLRHLSISAIYQQYLSCYWFDFDQILNVGSRDLYEHIPTVTMTSVQAIFVLATFVHIRNISAVTGPILTKL